MEKKFKTISPDMIVFRKATLNDIDQILKFDSLNDIPLFNSQNLKEEISNKLNYSIVAIINNQIVAYSTVSVLYDNADLLYISVHKDFRRIGIADNIIIILIDKLKQLKVKNILLEVRESNLSAIALYMKHGFIKIFERKNYYTSPYESAIIFKKEI